MKRKLFSLITLMICLTLSVQANHELTVVLDNLNHTSDTQPLEGFGSISFEYVGKIGNFGRVKVKIENLTMNPPLAIVSFNSQFSEKELKKRKPKIEFVKKYAGEKGKRSVNGCDIFQQRISVIPAASESEEAINLDVPLAGGMKFTLPLYIAKYKPKDLTKKGVFNTKFTILEEYIFDINIQVKAWSEDDPTFVDVNNGVERLIRSLDGVTFCASKKHKPSLLEQQHPYQEKIDSLEKKIQDVLDDNKDWTPEDAPYKAYHRLLSILGGIDLNSRIKNCPKHRAASHKCSYCSQNAQQLYHKIDDVYQQLHAGKITKEQALKTANAINTCFQQNRSRKKDDFYGNKIAGFYNRIVNY